MLKTLATLLIVLSAPLAWADSATGILTLSLLNKNFPVEDAYTILSASPRPALGFVHKSFGSRYSNLYTVLDKLSPKEITVVVYGDCGPCRPPRRPAGYFPLIAPHLSIDQLNRRLESADVKTLNLFRKEWEFILNSLQLRSNVKYRFQISLEDNLTPRAHKVLRSLALQIFRGRKDVIVGRNSMKALTANYPMEVHSKNLADLRKLKAGDIFTTDGFSLTYPGDFACESALKPSQARDLITTGRIRGVIVLIWTPEAQGLPFCPAGSLPMREREFFYIDHDFRYLMKILRR